MFVQSLLDKDAVWLLGIYVKLGWNTVIYNLSQTSQTMVKNESSLQYFNNKPDLAHIIGLWQ
jgi:hypothetical protein